MLYSTTATHLLIAKMSLMHGQCCWVNSLLSAMPYRYSMQYIMWFAKGVAMQSNSNTLYMYNVVMIRLCNNGHMQAMCINFCKIMITLNCFFPLDAWLEHTLISYYLPIATSISYIIAVYIYRSVYKTCVTSKMYSVKGLMGIWGYNFMTCVYLELLLWHWYG